MKSFTQNEIDKLQDNLLMIRHAGGWTAEEFGDMIGVTKQTIRNLENKKTAMTKTQYIAIRAVLDYEIAGRPDDKSLASAVELGLNSDQLPETNKKQAMAFIESSKKAGLDSDLIMTTLIAIIGAAAAEAVLSSRTTSGFGKPGGWLAKILKGKK